MLALDPGAAAAYIPPAVHPQWMGLARDIRRRVEREDAAVNLVINRLVDPVIARLKRFPRRSLRQEQINALITGWLKMDAIDFRLSCDARLDAKRAALTERRIVAGRLNRPGWDGDGETDIGVTEISLSVDRARVRLRTRCLCTFSLHAVARRLQRHQDGSMEALLADLAIAAEAAAGELTVGAGYRIRTDPDGGGWRGRAIAIRGTDLPVLAIRTWMSGGG